MCCYTVTSTWGWGLGGYCGHRNSELLMVLSLKERLCQKIALPTARNSAYNFSLSSLFAITFLLLLQFLFQHDTCQS